MKKITAILCLVSFFVLLGNKGFSQVKSSPNIDSNIEGTYQIQVIGTRAQPNIPGNLKEIVQKNRNATQVKYVSLGSVVKLKILPFSQINSSSFKPLTSIAHIAREEKETN